MYLDHELREPELSRFQIHLRTCKACRGHLDDQECFLKAVRAAGGRPLAPPDLRVSVRRILSTAIMLVVFSRIFLRNAF